MARVLLAYAVCYAVFSGLSKVGGGRHGPGAVLVGSVLAGAALWAVLVAVVPGWRAALARGLSPASILSGGASVGIMGASVLVYGEPRTSILLPLLLMKGGAVLLGVGVDRARRRPIDPRSACVATLATLAVVVAYGAKLRADSTAFAVACAAVYLLGYALKLPANDLGKGDPVPFLVAEITVTEVTASALVLAALPWVPGAVEAVRDPVVLAGGVASVGCGALGGLVILSPGGHTLLVSLSRCVTVLAGAAATVALGRPIAPAEAVGAAIMCVALAIGGRVRPRAAAR